MSTSKYIRPNALGDLRAEADRGMLRKAFLETTDYRTLIETSDRPIVVGRRGTGKSALALQLAQFFDREERTVVVSLMPEEHQTIGLRPQLELFGGEYSKVRAGARLMWRSALMLEAAHALTPTYKFRSSAAFPTVKTHLESWITSGADIFDRCLSTLKSVTDPSLSPDSRIASLSTTLHLTTIETALRQACSEATTSVVFLIDRLDEGYTPDFQGTGLIAGLVHAAIDLKVKISGIKPIIFLRDNIFRAVQRFDPDYSRNIEGSVLRLHWDVDSLRRFAAKRLQVAFSIPHDSPLKIWNACTASDLRGRDGFMKCLRQTLYRPRDLLVLLNEAFYTASKNTQSEIVGENITVAAKTISKNRLDDLRKEYDGILPGLPGYIGAFYDRSAEFTVEEACDVLDDMMAAGSDDSLVQQDFYIFSDAWDVLRGLYSIGFVGVRDTTVGSFVFCHDGRAPDRQLTKPDRVLVHPCYWIALNCGAGGLEPQEAEEIYDEYDIEISSETKGLRNSKIQSLIAQLAGIEVGGEGAAAFEEWCHAAIRICFAKGLRNVELKPNKTASSRRDIVATNLGEERAWQRIYEDYGTRQVTFEVKNVKDLSAADYQQIRFYLTGDYGRMAFVVTRSETVELYKGRDIDWVRERCTLHMACFSLSCLSLRSCETRRSTTRLIIRFTACWIRIRDCTFKARRNRRTLDASDGSASVHVAGRDILDAGGTSGEEGRRVLCRVGALQDLGAADAASGNREVGYRTEPAMGGGTTFSSVSRDSGSSSPSAHVLVDERARVRRCPVGQRARGSQGR